MNPNLNLIRLNNDPQVTLPLKAPEKNKSLIYQFIKSGLIKKKLELLKTSKNQYVKRMKIV